MLSECGPDGGRVVKRALGAGRLPAAHARNDTHDISGRLRYIEPRRVIAPHRLLDEHDAMISSESRQDVLRPLPYEVPTEVRMDYDWQIVCRVGVPNLG
ncbi:MAG: hypothetical protein ACM3SS_21620 [Rhodospirillaceae bacterium]